MSRRKAKTYHSQMIKADDRLARFTFSDPERTAGLIREFLPQDLVACLDLSQLRLIPDQHVDKHLRERRDDLNLECPILPEGKVLIRILLEHKSAYDSELWFQLFDTIVATWKRHGICPVIPIVLHTGSKKFSFASPQKRFQKMQDPIIKALPELPIFAIDLSECTMVRIVQSEQLDAVAKVILQIMKLVQLGNLDVRTIREVIRTQFPHEPSEVQRQYLAAAINYIQYKAPLIATYVENLRSDMALAHPIHPQSAFAQELREERAKGESRGIAKGAQQNQLKVIERMLAKGSTWDFITEVTGMEQREYEAMRGAYR